METERPEQTAAAMPRLDKAEIDRLAELTNIGAGRAADAFAQLVRRTIWVDVPVVCEGPTTRPDSADDVAATGVFFELEGCLDAMIGILFPEDASEKLVRRIVGIDEGELAPPIVESALMEVGNILASHVASAIADALGARLLPSIPTLAMEGAEAAFRDFVDRAVAAEAFCIESRLHDRPGELRGRLVVVPVRAVEVSGGSHARSRQRSHSPIDDGV